jgi:hypothetical protein
VSDEPITEGLQRALREGRFFAAAGIEDELPPSVENGVLNGLGIRRSRVRLEHDHHREQCWCDRHLTLTRCSIHRLEFSLKGVVEQHMALCAQESKELPRPLQAADHELLLLAQLFPRRPARCSHLSSW